MTLEVLSYTDIIDFKYKPHVIKKLEEALFLTGIVGISDVPEFVTISRNYIAAARKFSALEDQIKQQYAPNRDAGEITGYEAGAEWFKDENDQWRIDDKKISYYGYIPDNHKNKWPQEIDLKAPYQALGRLIFNTGKLILNAIGLDESVGLDHDKFIGNGRMLHYYKEEHLANTNPHWCGMHFDHGLFTGLIPAYYYRNGEEIDEPEEAGLYILPKNGNDYKKVNAQDKSILLFQVGEFSQIISNDKIRATKHYVQKANDEIERFTFALFYLPDLNMQTKSASILTKDPRYINSMTTDGSIRYSNWETASYAQYRAL